MQASELSFASRCVHNASHLGKKDPATLSAPIYQSTSYVFDSVQDGADKCESADNGHCYTRLSNPSNSLLEEQLAMLEHAEAGLCFSSGVAAISGTLLMALKTGDHCIADGTIYSATHYLFDTLLPKFGVQVDFADTSDIDAVSKLLRNNTRLIYCETPANPTMKVIDLEKLADLAKPLGILTIVDSTFATPYIQNPIEFGIDVVIHSTTKYVCGHGDAMGGVVLSTKKFIDNLRDVSLKNLGGCPAPFNSWLMMRGLKTLALRMERHCKNAIKVAKWLENQPQIAEVRYPGLESHPQHETAKRTMRDFGAIIAFDLKGGIEAGTTLMQELKMCVLAVSVGDTETLVEHPASMTHWYIKREERMKAGITDGLVRMSIGIEDADDIIADLSQALAKCQNN